MDGPTSTDIMLLNGNSHPELANLIARYVLSSSYYNTERTIYWQSIFTFTLSGESSPVAYKLVLTFTFFHLKSPLF